MAKYYVDSGEMQKVGIAENAEEAAINSMMAFYSETISAGRKGFLVGEVVRVNQQGFSELPHDSDEFLVTCQLLDKMTFPEK